MNNSTLVSERIKRSRKVAKLTQEELGRRVNTTKATISNYENSYSTPSNLMLVALADMLDVTTDYLLGRTDDTNGVVEVDRETKALIKKSENNKPSKYDALKNEFEEYKRNNEIKISVINDLREENRKLKSYMEEIRILASKEDARTTIKQIASIAVGYKYN